MPKRPRTESANWQPNQLLDAQQLISLYHSTQLIHLKSTTIPSTPPPSPLSYLAKTFAAASALDVASWTLENQAVEQSPAEFLGEKTGETGYCSFILQHDKAAVASVLEYLPVSTIPLANINNGDGVDEGEGEGEGIRTCQPLWCFIGRNHSSASIPGRKEHTDSVSHDGTFHYQLSGSKTWMIRPTKELAELSTNDWEESSRLEVTVEAGDVFFLNTRLWWHQTSLPSSTSTLSISVARDVFLGEGGEEAVEGLTNIDGVYAPNDLAKGTIVFKEDDAPDAELHRTSAKDKANCEVIELDDGMMAVVTTKDVKAGEFLSIVETDDDESSSSGGEWEEEEFCAETNE